MKKNSLLTLFIGLIATTAVNATPIAGFSDVMDNGDGSYTFVFDTLTADINDIDGNAMGLSFSGFGLGMTVTGSDTDTVRQDYPGDAGLGILGEGGTDNFEPGLGESMLFSFNGIYDLVGITFNGLMGGTGHTDEADGTLVMSGHNFGWVMIANNFDGVGADYQWGQVNNFETDFLALSSFNLSVHNTAEGDFKGYVESVTVRSVESFVPEPTGIVLLGLGVLGLVISRRKIV